MKQHWAQTANALADLAAPIAKKFFRKPVELRLKQDGSSVSTADLAIELAMRDYLQIHHPEHSILGEEYGTTGNSEYTWVLDPIDGTASFLSGKPMFCTLVALLHHGQPILGLVSQPILEERWLGIAGARTLFNGEMIPHCPAPEQKHLRFSCTTPQMFRSNEEKLMYKKACKQATICSYGGDAYAYGLLALGMIDMILEADLAYYDIAALIPIIEGVGGQITDWQGQRIEFEHFNGQVLALRQISDRQRSLSINPLPNGQ